MIQIKLVNKAKTTTWHEDSNNKANLGCRESPNFSMKVNYSHNCMKLNL